MSAVLIERGGVMSAAWVVIYLGLVALATFGLGWVAGLIVWLVLPAAVLSAAFILAVRDELAELEERRRADGGDNRGDRGGEP